ncbi:MAG: hypothetical protein V7785_00970 [Bermanella sp.]
MMNKRQGLIVGLLMIFSLQAMAYSLKNHEQITRDASALINECRQQKLITTLNPEAQLPVLIAYNLDQDQILRKARLWHFPFDKNQPPLKSATSWVGNTLVISTSFNLWTDYLYTQAQLTRLHREIYPAMGALLHYIQDVSVPAHAVPIFHPVRYFPPKADGFDSWQQFNAYPWLQNEAQLKKVCGKIAAQDGNAQSILASTQQQTRDNIQNGMGLNAEPDVWLKLYPLDAAKPDGFAQYGCDSGGDYGDAVLNCDDQQIEVPLQDYINFASAQRNLATVASARLIYVMQQALSVCDGPNCVAKDGDEHWLPNASQLRRLLRN